ncbi:adenosylcobinamide-GDP ribazoletransferase [Cellvibrio zantedeschiae]|uniref:Adenosylcobinamide-GDP ribazoletransferase n=1 Tax=Cellvibrio zantedeschiae TaxID=1237077 RepID=A0ABQ3B387_9GAMM|nr:adenosylcobinamide-GDP ribazoletransferase [Cellvibrio zantedeschiae]GGY74554.1 adenosylcobinamide-GDP ribazoletransferase [Cellvibrio zantedeschiae]
MLKAIQDEFNLFFLALGYFSRIPMPKWVVYSTENLNHASRYFTLVGWLLGLCVGGIYFLSHQFFSTNISIWLCMLFSLLLTGAFHEDGLADTADGLGGGFTRERKLEIMKDSRIGTYGTCALLMALVGKFILLQETTQIILCLCIAYALSRMLASSLLFTMPSASSPENEKVKPLAKTQSRLDMLVLIACGLPVIFLISIKTFLLLLLLLVVLRYLLQIYFNRHLGGVTGDCLGASQQVTELCIYLLLVSQGY